MIQNIIDARVREILGDHARSLNQRTAHGMDTFMRDGLAGYSECQRIPCNARFNVGYKTGDPAGSVIITDDTASGTPCPNLLS